MTDLVKFWIGADFVIPRVRLTAPEIAYGYRKGWIDAADVVKLVVNKLETGPVTPAEEQIALLLSDQLDEVWELLEQISPPEGGPDDPSKVWLYLALAWLLDHESLYDDPLRMIEMIHADFGYPDEIDPLIGYMEPIPGEAPGVEGIRDRWRRYVRDKGAAYRARDAWGRL